MAADTLPKLRRRHPEGDHAIGSRQPAAPPARSTPAAEHARDAAGNQAVQRLLGTTVDRARAAAGRADDPREQDAARAADHSRAAVPPADVRRLPPTPARVVREGGRPLPSPLRRSLESRVGAPLSTVRVHTAGVAAAAAATLDANAFTIGEDIVFGEAAFAPDTREGAGLLLHEIAHVLQQRRFGIGLDRQPRTTPSGSDTTTLPQPDPGPGPAGYDLPVTIDVPILAGEKRERDEKQTLMLHVEKKGEPEHYKFFAVPIAKLKLPKADLKKPPAPPAGPPSVDALPPSHPDIPPGSVVETFDGAKLTALASTPEHIITGEYNKYAVGAGSTSAVKLADNSVIIIDAGVNASRMGVSTEALKKLTLDKLSAFIGDGVVRELLISHAHADHVSLAPDIIQRFPIDTIRINDVMARWSGYKALRQLLVDRQKARIDAAEAAFREQMKAERVAWEKGEGAGHAPDAREAAWEKYVDARLKEKLPELPAARQARERILIQSKNKVLDVADVDLATGAKRGTAALDPDLQKSPNLAAEDPYVTVRETQAPLTGDRANDRRRNTKSSDIDPNASAYVIVLKGGMTLLVLPDMRANDLERITKRFADVMATLKRPVDGVQVWDATHHMQKGWYAGGVPGTQLAKIVDFLTAYASKKGADVVVVSAQADLSAPGAKTLVDPVNIWLLRSLGFEVYLATSGRDVRVIDIVTSQGTKLTGVIGAKAPGEGPAELTTKRAKAALDQLAAERQAQRVARKEEKNPAEREKIDKRLAEIDAIEKELRPAYEEHLAEIHQKLAAPKRQTHTTQDLTDVTKQDFPKQKALDLLLEKHNFDRPVTTDVHLTEMALVVINQDAAGPAPPPGSPGARARELASVRSKIYEIDARIKAGEVTPAIQGELIAEMVKYRTILNNELNPTDPAQKPIEGVSRSLLTDDLKSIDARIGSLTEGEGVTNYSRRVGSGEVIEQHAVVIKPLKPPSQAVQKTQAVLEAVGRGMGLVMMVTTVTGQGELMRRWQEGQANNAEAALGTARNIISGAVGLQMLRGVNVNPGVFVVISILEIGEAAFRDYDSKEQRDIETAYAAASAAINLGCMVVGGLIMKIPNPVTMIAGFLITMAGPFLLKLLGVHAWLERELSFNPSDVVRVYQDLRELITKYRVVIGSLQLAKRAQDVTDPTVTDRAGAKEEADKLVTNETTKALDLEQDIYSAFEKAYRDAKTDYAGLRDLDQYRAQFYMLRQQAGLPAAEAVAKIGRPSLRSPDDVFRQIDANLTFGNLSDDEIRHLPQWSSIDDELIEFQSIVGRQPDEDYQTDVRDKDHRLQLMFDNARYRLDPTAQGGERTKPLLDPGSNQRRVYEAELVNRESTLSWIRYQYVSGQTRIWGVLTPTGDEAPVPGKTTPWPLNLEWVAAMLDGSITNYKLTVQVTTGPPESLVAAMFSESAHTEEYRTYVKDHASYNNELQRLETIEQVIDGYFTDVERLMPSLKDATGSEPEKLNRKWVADARENMKTARSVRYFKKGMLYLSELDGLRTQVWTQETKTIAPLFDDKERNVKPLTPEEELALTENRGKFDPDEKIVPPLSRLLQITKSPMELAPDGSLQNVARLGGRLQLYVGATAVFPTMKTVSPASNALVGILAAGRIASVRDAETHTDEDAVGVTPLNHAAIALFGGVRMYLVPIKNLFKVTAAEVEKLKQASAVPVDEVP